MIRQLFLLASAVSLLLCVAAASLWARGMWVGDFIWRNGVGGATGCFSANGRVMVTLRTSSSFNPITPGVGPPEWEVMHERPPRNLLTIMDTLHGPTGYGRFAGLAWGAARDRGRVTSRDMVAPLWAVVLPTAIAPAILLWRRLRAQRRRLAIGLCPRCGYDLRASPDRCPECGTPAPKQVEAAA